MVVRGVAKESRFRGGGGLPYDNDQLFVGFFSVVLSLHFCKAMVVGYEFSSIQSTVHH